MGLNLGTIYQQNLADEQKKRSNIQPNNNDSTKGIHIGTIYSQPKRKETSIETLQKKYVEEKENSYNKASNKLYNASKSLNNFLKQNKVDKFSNFAPTNKRDYNEPLKVPTKKDFIDTAKKAEEQQQKIYSSETYKGLKENVDKLSEEEDKAYREYRKAIGKEEEPWYRKILQTPEALKDGYDFGDITKTLLSTGGDIALSLEKSFQGIGQNALNLLNNAAAQVGDWIGQDEWADKVRENVKNNKATLIPGVSNPVHDMANLNNPVTNTNLEPLVNKDSILGDTSREAIQGVGYYTGMTALQSVGIPWQATAATTSIGSELPEAYANGATDGQAWASAINSAAWEVASEYISGGIPLPGTGKGLDKLASGFTEKLKNNTAKYLLEAGYQMGGEGLEELISGLGSSIGKKLTYMSDKDFAEIYSKEDALKDFVIGGAVAGLTNSINPTTWHNINSGKSLLTGRTSQEANSRNETIQKLSVEAEQSKGKPLSSKEKIDIEDYVDGTMLDTLYSLKADLENTEDDKAKASLTKQIEDLQDKITNVVLSTKSLDILQYQLNRQNQTIQSTMQSSAVNDENTMSSMLIQNNVKNSIAPQQNVNPSNQVFQFTTTGNTKVDNFLQSAVDSRFNNTKQSQDFLNSFSKVISDKGYNVLFDSTINKNGKSVNGQITTLKNGEVEIRINPNSNNAGEFLIVHEITHAVENEGLRELIINYAQKHYDFKAALQDKMNLYGTNEVTSEVVADISAQILGNQEFINSLTMQNTPQSKTLIRKIYDSIKRLVNTFTSEGRYKNFVQDLEQKWREAYRSTTQEQAVSNLKSNTSYSIGGIKAINSMADSKYKFDALYDYNRALEMAESGKYSNEQIRKETKWFQDKNGDWKFEFDDSSITLKTEILHKNGAYKLGDIIEHDYLFKLYPELKDYDVIFENMKANGSFNVKDKRIRVNNNLLNSTEYKSLKGTILHETQHAIQYIERFQTGMNARLSKKAYYTSLGEVEANDTKMRYMNDYTKEGRKNIAPESSKSHPTHPEYDNYMKNRGTIDKIKDAVYPLYGGILQNAKKNQEVFSENKRPNNRLVDGRGLLDNSSFSFDENVKRYDDLKSTNKIEFFKKDNGDIQVSLIDSNNNLVNQFDLISNNDAIKQLGNDIANYLIDNATDDYKTIYIGNDINNLGNATDYFMNHRPNEDGATSDNLANQNIETPGPKDLYEHPEYYFPMNEEYSRESIRVLNKIKGNPNADVTIYRATIGNEINPGDWVTLSKTYAELHNESQFDGKANILQKEVKAKDVKWAMDDINEFGYYPTDNNVKNSISNADKWQEYLDRHYKATGTRTNMNSIIAPTRNKGLDNSSFSFAQEQSNRLTQKEQVELNNLNNLPFELSQEEQNRKTYLENKAKGLIKYPELSPKITFEDIRNSYSKYKNLNDFNSNILDKAESFISGYRNTSRRTKAEWLEVAKFIGANLNAKNSTELEKYAIQSWHSAKPNIKENLNRQGQGYVKFSIDEWVNQIYKSAGVGETIKGSNNTKNSIKAPLKNSDTNKVVAPTRETLNSSSKVSNPSEIAQLTPEDANTTQKLNSKQRKWVKTSTESNPVKGKVLIENLDSAKTNYVVRSNESTLQSANSKLNSLGYDESISYIKSKMSDKKVDLEDIALAERLIQESIKNGDTKTASDLIMDVAILGTELGQKVQALSIIQKLTPEGQLAMYQKIVSRAKIKGEKAYTDVNITQDMVDTILGAYNEDGTYNQDDLNERVEIFKQQVAEQLKSSKSEKINEWRYLSMLGNPKTHIRNMVSNLAMTGTIKVKNAMARTGEAIASKLTTIERTKTWKKSSDTVTNFAKQTAEEMKSVISGESKYGEKASIESKKQVFKSKTLERISDFNSNALEAEDWFFSKRAFQNSFSEYLTANGIETQQDITNNAKLIEKAKLYAVEQAEIATFRQYSKLASLINKFERNNKVAGLAIGATIPFKKTPINVAKAGVNYSPIGLIKSISYDAFQLHKGNINASQFIDNVSQGMTGTALTLLGYALAKAGFVSGAGDDDKEGKMDYYLGNQSYSLKFGKTTFPISWVSPVAMPFLVGANAYEKLENQEEWDANIVIDTLAQTLDPLSEMSFISSLTDVLQSYNQGSFKMLSSMGTKAAQSYIGQFFPTLFSQIAATFDDTKRSTSASKNSSFKVAEETVRQIMYKIPGLRNMLEPSTNIWGEEQKQSDNIFVRAFNNFINPSSPKSYAPTKLENELKRVYRETGDSSVIPGIPYGNIKYKGINYQMSSEEYTKYKKTYGQNAKQKLTALIDNDDYKKATDEQKAKMIDQVFDFSKAIANEEYFKSIKIDFSSDNLKTIKELKELGFSDKTIIDYTAKYAIINSIKQDKTLTSEQKQKNIASELINSNFNNKELAYMYDKAGYSKKEKLDALITMNIPIKEFIKLDSSDISSDYDTSTGKAITNSKKNKYIKYVDSLKLSTPQKAILIKMQYNSYNNYNDQIVKYIDSLKETINDKKILLTRIGFDDYRKEVINYVMSKYKNPEERIEMLKQLGYTIRNGRVYW